MKTLMFDVEKCIGCRNCQLSCKDEHVGNDWLPIAKAQSEGQLWLRVEERERGTSPKVRVDWLVVMCQQCQEAPCMQVCQDEAIYRRTDQIVIIDPQKCTGCQDCIAACPYGVIYYNSESEIAQKCTLCAHLLDRGWKEPRCVTACPTEALTYVQDEEAEVMGDRYESLKPEENTQPTVIYMGLPMPYIAGEVYSPVEDICLMDVLVEAVDVSSGDVVSVFSDNYGDFWLNGLQEGEYQVSFEKDGYYPKTLTRVRLGEALNLGEVKLYKKTK